MSGAGVRKWPRPECPTGEQLIAELRAHADTTGAALYDVIRPLLSVGSNASNWIRQTAMVKCPRPHTVERVRALIDGRPLPPLPEPPAVRSPSDAPRRGKVGRARRSDRAVFDGTMAQRAEPRPSSLQDEIAAGAAQRERQFRQAGKLSGTVKHALDRPAIAPGQVPSPSDLIRWARRDWPEVCAEVEAFAAESDIGEGEAWQRVLLAGIQCLREAD